MNKMMILLALATSISGVAQERNAEIGEPKGKAIVEVFGNYKWVVCAKSLLAILWGYGE